MIVKNSEGGQQGGTNARTISRFPRAPGGCARFYVCDALLILIYIRPTPTSFKSSALASSDCTMSEKTILPPGLSTREASPRMR